MGNGVWSVVTPSVTKWNKVMQFKRKRHAVDSAQSEQSWNSWFASVRGETTTLLIYEYGLAISKESELKAFLAACIQP